MRNSVKFSNTSGDVTEAYHCWVNLAWNSRLGVQFGGVYFWGQNQVKAIG